MTSSFPLERRIYFAETSMEADDVSCPSRARKEIGLEKWIASLEIL